MELAWGLGALCRGECEGKGLWCGGVGLVLVRLVARVRQGLLGGEGWGVSGVMLG